MTKLVRMSMSVEEPLYRKLEQLRKAGGHTNRSEFIRALVRDRLVNEQWKKGEEVLGTVTIVYDHEKRALAERLTRMQHHHHEAILASTHVHLDRRMCAEVIIIRAKAEVVQHIAESLRKQRGVLHAELSMSSLGKGIG